MSAPNVMFDVSRVTHTTCIMYVYTPHPPFYWLQVLGTIMRRKTVNVMSSDMDHWIEKRGELSKHLDELKGQRARLMEADKVVRHTFCFNQCDIV